MVDCLESNNLCFQPGSKKISKMLEGLQARMTEKYMDAFASDYGTGQSSSSREDGGSHGPLLCSKFAIRSLLGCPASELSTAVRIHWHH